MADNPTTMAAPDPHTVSALTEVRVDFSCPACGEEGYEEVFDASDVSRATQVTIPCDSCSARITIEVDVRIEAESPR